MAGAVLEAGPRNPRLRLKFPFPNSVKQRLLGLLNINNRRGSSWIRFPGIAAATDSPGRRQAADYRLKVSQVGLALRSGTFEDSLPTR